MSFSSSSFLIFTAPAAKRPIAATAANAFTVPPDSADDSFTPTSAGSVCLKSLNAAVVAPTVVFVVVAVAFNVVVAACFTVVAVVVVVLVVIFPAEAAFVVTEGLDE